MHSPRRGALGCNLLEAIAFLGAYVLLDLRARDNSERDSAHRT